MPRRSFPFLNPLVLSFVSHKPSIAIRCGIQATLLQFSLPFTMYERTSLKDHPPAVMPEEDRLLTSLERTARWVEEQSRVDYVESSIPSRSSASTTNTLPSNRTTSSSEQSIPLSRQRTLPPPISHADLIASQSSTPVPAARVVSKTESRPRTLRHSRPRIPFPQGPPGSGFPLLLKQDPPRSENGESRSKVSDSIAKFQVEVFVWSS